MAIKISKKIKSYSVATPEGKAAAPAVVAVPAPLPTAEIIQMHERLERPESLIGATYKVKSPLFEHALYVTINDIVLNPGTEHELRRPFELFINSKNMEHFQWIVAITRIVSAVFRKGGDVTFLVEEMKAVFDPRGGYFKAGGVYMPSIIAEIGSVIEEHLKSIGMIVDPEISDAQRALLHEKRAAYEQSLKKNAEMSRAPTPGGSLAVDGLGGSERSGERFPPTATLCGKCHTKAVVVMDGCQTCLSCGYSKCG